MGHQGKFLSRLDPRSWSIGPTRDEEDVVAYPVVEPDREARIRAAARVRAARARRVVLDGHGVRRDVDIGYPDDLAKGDTTHLRPAPQGAPPDGVRTRGGTRKKKRKAKAKKVRFSRTRRPRRSKRLSRRIRRRKPTPYRSKSRKSKNTASSITFSPTDVPTY